MADHHSQLIRLAASAALETHGDYRPIDAWSLTGKMAAATLEALKDAGELGIRAQARMRVLEIMAAWHHKRADRLAQRLISGSYPARAEPAGVWPGGACPVDPPPNAPTP